MKKKKGIRDSVKGQEKEKPHEKKGYFIVLENDNWGFARIFHDGVVYGSPRLKNLLDS